MTAGIGTTVQLEAALFPVVAIGGASLFAMIIGQVPGYLDNPVRQDLWRAGHAHAGIMLIVALVLLRYVDETTLRGPWLWIARHGVPVAAILMPLGFSLSVLSPDSTEPNALIALVPVGRLFLAAGVITTGVALVRSPHARDVSAER